MAAGDASFHLIKSYAKYNKGYLYTLLILLCQVIWMAFNASTNLWISAWTESESLPVEKHPSSFYIKWYVVLGLFYGTFAFIRSLMVSYSSP